MAVNNFNFKDGLMWLPVKHDTVTNTEIKQPLYLKGDTGSLMPYIAIQVPGIFDNLVLPYENVLEFTYTAFGGDSPGVATVSFIDTTPLFIETVLRAMYNARNQNAENFKINIDYGWRVQNPTKEISDFVESGVFSAGVTPFHLIHAAYKYSTHGVTASLNLRAATVNVLNSYKVEKTTLKSKNIKNKDTFSLELTNFINSVVKKPVVKDGYKIVVESNNIVYDNLSKNDIAFDSNESLSGVINTVVGKLYVPNSKKAPQGSEIRYHISHKPIKEKELVGGSITEREVIPIFIYERDNPPKSVEYIPFIEYPSNETPILSFTPSLGVEENTFLYSDRYSTINSLGNRTIDEVPLEAITSFYSRANKESGQSVTVNTEELSEDEILSKERSRAILNTISISMMGDPTFSTHSIKYSDVEVRMNEIVSDGVLRNKKDFFGNFPQIPLTKKLLGGNFIDTNDPNIKSVLSNISDRGLLPIINGIPGEISPFNGKYRIISASHKINPSDGYVTDLELQSNIETEDSK